MITKENPIMNSTAESIYQSNADFFIREKCYAREEAIARENYMQNRIKEQEEEISRLKALLKENGVSYE